jgi:hypothetical protein
VGTWLDDTIDLARRERRVHVPAEAVNKLQPWIMEDGRLILRLRPDVIVIESAHLAGTRERVGFVLVDPRYDRRVALALLPEVVEERLSSRAHLHAILAGGDVDAVITLRGKDIVRNLADCMCLLARLEHRMFTDHGFEQVLIQANSSSRRTDLNRTSVTFVRVPWIDDDGEERCRSIRVVCRVRYRPRPARAQAA